MADLKVLKLTTAVVASYVGKSHTAMGEIPALIQSVHSSFATLGQPEPMAEDTKKTPAVPIRKSITPDFLISLENGQKYKSLKRHLRTKYDLSPEEYRAKWGLPTDYPMVSPNYAARRSEMAKAFGLGTAGLGRPKKPGRKKASATT